MIRIRIDRSQDGEEPIAMCDQTFFGDDEREARLAVARTIIELEIIATRRRMAAVL